MKSQTTVIMWGSMNKAQLMSVLFVLAFGVADIRDQRPMPGNERECVTHRIMRNAINPSHDAAHPLAPAEELDTMHALDYQLTLALTRCGAGR